MKELRFTIILLLILVTYVLLLVMFNQLYEYFCESMRGILEFEKSV